MLDTGLACGHQTCAGFAKGWVTDSRDASVIPSVWVGVSLVVCWPQHIGGAVALLGRSGDTMVCGRGCVLHTGAGQYRSGHHAVGLVRAGLPKVGTFRRHQTVPLCLCSWQVGASSLPSEDGRQCPCLRRLAGTSCNRGH